MKVVVAKLQSYVLRNRLAGLPVKTIKHVSHALPPFVIVVIQAAPSFMASEFWFFLYLGGVLDVSVE